jgi:hypothetical protein
VREVRRKRYGESAEFLTWCERSETLGLGRSEGEAQPNRSAIDLTASEARHF